jgi:hypothetical protein
VLSLTVFKSSSLIRCRYEFANNEFVTALDLVSLETQSTESGYKEFIAVGTTINRGEDLAVRGAVSIYQSLGFGSISNIILHIRCTSSTLLKSFPMPLSANDNGGS